MEPGLTRRAEEHEAESMMFETVEDLSSSPNPNPGDHRKWTRHQAPPTGPLQALLRDAQYIQRHAEKWEEDTNPIVQVSKTMSTQICHMTQYVRRSGPITSHLGLVKTAKAMAENSEKILKFANILIRHCVDQGFCADLKSYCSQVPTIIRQLTILANVQLGTAQSDTADHILVQNAQNLMKKVLQMMDACEAVSIKGLSPSMSSEDNSAVELANRWRQKYQEHRLQGNVEMNTDELGLRVIEDEVMPPALSQLFQSRAVLT